VASILVRNGTNKVNLASTGGTYNLSSYTPGIPQPANSFDGVTINGYSGDLVVDTFTLDIVGENRESVSRNIARLYRSLCDARDYLINEYPVPVFFETTVPGSTKTLYAMIVDFQFHELPNWMDIANGHIVRQASLVITRKPWSEAPPQDVPYLWKNSRYRSDQGWDAHNLFKIETQYSLPIRNDTSSNARRYARGSADYPDHTIFLSSCDRGCAVEWIAPSAGPLDDYVAPSYYGNNSVIFTPGTDYGPYFRATTPHNGLVWSLDQSPLTPNNPETYKIQYQNNNSTTYTDMPSLVKAPNRLTRSKQLVMAWRGRESSYLGNWIGGNGGTAPLISGISGTGWWTRINLDTSEFTQQARAIAGYPVYAPTRPWLDVVGPDSAMPLPTRIGIKMWTPTEDDSLLTGMNQFMRENGRFNRLIIATAYEGMTSTVLPDSLPYGFYNLDDDLHGVHPEYSVELVNSSSFNSDRYAPANRAVFVNPDDASFGTGNFTRIISLDMPWSRGLYRAFMRFRIIGTSKPADVNIHMRMSLSKSQYATPVDATVKTQTYTVSTNSPYVGYHNDQSNYQTNVADFGTVKLGPDYLSPGEPYSIRVNIEFAYSGTPTDELNIALYDIILLPVNSNYTLFAGQRSPEAVVAPGGEVEVDYGMPMPYALNARGLFIDGMSPSGVEAATVSTWVSSGDAEVDNDYPPETLEYWTPLGGGLVMLKPNVRQRIYFFMYKIGPDGVMTSENDIVFSANIWSCRNYLTLPGVY
jgi:hypothetical protein